MPERERAPHGEPPLHEGRVDVTRRQGHWPDDGLAVTLDLGVRRLLPLEGALLDEGELPHAGTCSPSAAAGTFFFPEPSRSRSALAAARSCSKWTIWPAAPQLPSGTSRINVQIRTPAPSPQPV